MRYIENKVLYLYHDDVIFLFAKFLDNIKFRRLLTLQYPIILIDEYQDSLKIIIDQFLNWYIEKGEGPQFGFFGDAWQTIYDKNSCGIIDSPNIIVIGKESNFRSEQVIVDALNNIRPELPQISATDDNDGFIHVVICNDYKGKRQTRYYDGELPNEIITERVNKLQKILNERYGWSSNEDHITLMITHKMLAKQQNYEKLLVLLNERLKDGEDAYLKFFSKTIEPLYAALEKKQMTQLFEVLGSNRYPIEYKRQKNRWNELKAQLESARKNTVGDVMNVLYNNLDLHIPISPKVQEGHKKFLENQNTKYEKGTIGEYYKISYVEVLNAIAYLNLDTEYSTDHGVKGKEYENVLWVIGRGWNNYQFDKYMGIDPSTLSGKDYDAYIRNRNLFYVCCSRAKKRLVLFITILVKEEFLKYLQRVFGKENIYFYEEYIQS